MRRTQKAGFSTPITRVESVLGFFILAFHIFALPPLLKWLPGAFGAAPLSDRHLNLIYYAVSFVLCAVFLFRFLRNSFRGFFDRFGGTVGTIVLGFVAYYALSYVLSLIMNLVSGNISLPEVSAAKLNPDALAVIALLLAPVVEETLFRGVAFGVIRKKSRVFAYIVSFLLFAVYHVFWGLMTGFTWAGLLAALYYLPAALVLCWTYERSGSVWTPIVLHILINCVSLYLTIG